MKDGQKETGQKETGQKETRQKETGQKVLLVGQKVFILKFFLSLDLEQRYFFFMAVFSDEQWIIIINQFISK